MNDHDEWRRDIDHLTEFERLIDCTHTRRHAMRFCPDCGDENPGHDDQPEEQDEE